MLISILYKEVTLETVVMFTAVSNILFTIATSVTNIYNINYNGYKSNKYFLYQLQLLQV